MKKYALPIILFLFVVVVFLFCLLVVGLPTPDETGQTEPTTTK